MKKHYLTLVLFVFFANYSFSQYSVEYSTETYTQLMNADTIDESLTFQFNTVEIHLPVPIGFDFEINGEIFDSIALAKRGFAAFRDVDLKYALGFFDCELKDFNDDPINSPILYKTEGPVGDRIFKCEYKMQGFMDDPEDDDFVSAQLWLYENCNNFEIRIGSYQVNSSVFLADNPAPYMGFGDYQNPSNSQRLSGSPTDPDLVWFVTTLDTIPPINSVYSFSDCTVGINELSTLFSLYPNPTNDILEVFSDNLTEAVEVSVFDLLGTKFDTYTLSEASNKHTIELGHLSSGAYLFVFTSKSETSSYKIIKN